MCETLWFVSWVNTHLLDLNIFALCPKFSGDSYVGFQAKTILGDFFTNFRTNEGTESGEISPYFLQFLFCVRIALKKFTQILSYVFCTQLRRHVHKRITKRRYREEKSGRFVFKKQLCSLSVWDLLHLTPLVFLSEIFTRCSSLCLLSFR